MNELELLSKYSAYLARILEAHNIDFERDYEKWSRHLRGHDIPGYVDSCQNKEETKRAI